MQRREFLIQTGLASLAPAAAQAGTGSHPDLKITDIKTYLVGVGNRNLLFVKVETDQGIHGIGEAYSCGPDEATVAALGAAAGVQDVRECLCASAVPDYPNRSQVGLSLAGVESLSVDLLPFGRRIALLSLASLKSESGCSDSPWPPAQLCRKERG